jgi:CheY-like chemotaxis protein
LDNLLSNACKFTEKGTVTLRVEREAADGKDWLAFHISDTGIGMTPEQQQKLFQAFVQADATTTRKFGGTGLGLVITRNLCRMMGGDVSVTSQKGAGTTFTMRLPAEVSVPSPEPGSWDSRPRQSTPGANNRPQVLVIDDEPMVQELLARFLSKEGFHVATAASGEEGLRLARQMHPGAVTLDVLMPGMDGWSVLVKMKTDPALADIPVIMLTIVDDQAQGYALGAADYVTKPIDRRRLLQVLKKHCGVGVPGLGLLVEDDPNIRGPLRRALEGEGWTVAEARNGREALEQVTRQRPDVVLLDLLMPEMDGFEFLHHLRRHESWRSIPVVVLTAKDLTPQDRQRLNGQVDRILHKECYSREELLGQLTQLLASQLPTAPKSRNGAR